VRGGGWFLIALIAVEIFIFAAKPNCREGFTPAPGFGGWYCRAKNDAPKP
jgi:hypothetical protein